jgi:hypothetical protein
MDFMGRIPTFFKRKREVSWAFHPTSKHCIGEVASSSGFSRDYTLSGGRCLSTYHRMRRSTCAGRRSRIAAPKACDICNQIKDGANSGSNCCVRRRNCGCKRTSSWACRLTASAKMPQGFPGRRPKILNLLRI